MPNKIAESKTRFQDRVASLEKRFGTFTKKQTEQASAFEEGYKRLVETLRKENEKFVAMSEAQQKRNDEMELKLKEELRIVSDENRRSSSRISNLIDSRFERFSTTINEIATKEASGQRAHSEHGTDLTLRLPPSMRVVMETHENACAVMDCNVQMALRLTFSSLHAALLRERTRREEDEEKLTADVELAVSVLASLPIARFPLPATSHVHTKTPLRPIYFVSADPCP